MDAVRLNLLPAPLCSGRPLAESGRCSASLRLYSALHSEQERVSLEEMEVRARRELLLEAISGLHAAQKAIEDRLFLINPGHLVCIECRLPQPHHVALQAHLIKVHGTKRLRKAFLVLLKEHAPEALRIKTERYATLMASYAEFCAEEARLRLAQVSTEPHGPPWPLPPQHSPPSSFRTSPLTFPPISPGGRAGRTKGTGESIYRGGTE